MIVPLRTLSPDSRVWIFQCSRPLGSEEIARLDDALSRFLTTWTAHNQALQSGYEIKDGWFVTVAVDENVSTASGCSIDKLTHFMKQQEQEYGLSFFDRLTVLVRFDTGELRPFGLRSFQDAVKSSEVSPALKSFDNLVPTLAHYLASHERPLFQTWLAKYFPQEVLAEI